VSPFFLSLPLQNAAKLGELMALGEGRRRDAIAMLVELAPDQNPSPEKLFGKG
jgi:hypothetical protein